MVKILPKNLKPICSTILQNLAEINTYEKIHLIQACIYHDRCTI